MTTRAEIDEKLAELEKSPRHPDEEQFIQACQEAINPDQHMKISETDLLTCVRGYATYVPRKEETVKAFVGICDWRDEVGFYDYLYKRLNQDEEFYNYWPEYIYGNDKYGHPLVSMHVEQIDADKLTQMDEAHVLRLQGQKQALYSYHKKVVSAQIGVQRYKYSLLVDLNGAGMSLLSGKKRTIIKKVFDVGADHFPESIWKIYVVNTPFLFRAAWAMVKPWIHPITQAKVNIFGAPADAKKAMMADGFPEESLPDWLGGGSKGIKTFDYLVNTIKSNEGKAPVFSGGPDGPTSKSSDNTTTTTTEGVPSEAQKALDDRVGPLAAV